MFWGHCLFFKVTGYLCMSNFGKKVGCINMHRNLSMHIIHVFIKEFEMFLNLYCGLGRHADARSQSKVRP